MNRFKSRAGGSTSARECHRRFSFMGAGRSCTLREWLTTFVAGANLIDSIETFGLVAPPSGNPQFFAEQALVYSNPRNRCRKIPRCRGECSNPAGAERALRQPPHRVYLHARPRRRVPYYLATAAYGVSAIESWRRTPASPLWRNVQVAPERPSPVRQPTG
jgi:hypothetical protein